MKGKIGERSARDLPLQRTQKGKETNKQKANVTKIEEYIRA